MVDQLSALALPAYGHKIVKTPHLDRLAEEGTVFDTAYCNFPICAPSRFSMLTGQLATRTHAYDNGTEFTAGVPTLLHYLRYLGYHTSLSGKMHFIGPDQLHGYEERLTTDIYPADYKWIANWSEYEKFSTSGAPKGHQTLSIITEAGICKRNLQFDFDEATAYHAIQKIYDLARSREKQKPFFLTVSFTHPHHPFETTQEYWSRYRHDDIDMPSIPMLPVAQQDDHSRRLHRFLNPEGIELTKEHIRNARHTYYANISYVDDKVGQLLDALEDSGLEQDTIVIFTSDHGEMLGERGLWFKFNFFEWSMRVPLIIHIPGSKTQGRSDGIVSLIDLLPTILDLASNGNPPGLIDPIDGASLTGLLSGDDPNWSNLVMAENTADFAIAPSFMLQKGRFKFIYCQKDRDQLYDLDQDPMELKNLAEVPAYKEIVNQMRKEVFFIWNPDAIYKDVLAYQKRHLFLRDVLDSGAKTSWDYQPFQDASKQYVRGAPVNYLSKRRLPYLEVKET